MASSHKPIACTLTTKDAANQLLEWSDLRSNATAVEALADGARMRFPAKLEADIQDLVRREAACCAFLTITTVRIDDELVVDVTSPDPEAMPVISAVAGLSET